MTNNGIPRLSEEVGHQNIESYDSSVAPVTLYWPLEVIFSGRGNIVKYLIQTDSDPRSVR